MTWPQLKTLTLRRVNSEEIQHATARTIIGTSIVAAIVLTIVFLVHDISSLQTVRLRTLFAALCGICFLFIRAVLIYKSPSVAKQLLVSLYAAVALGTLLVFGIETTEGILTLGFTITVAGALLGARAIPPIISCTSAALIGIHLYHSMGGGTVLPPPTPSPLGDIFAHIAMFSGFSFVTWLAVRQAENTLRRAQIAEERLGRQQLELKEALSKQSLKLKQSQRNEAERLYTFAVIGQSAAATLHEFAHHITLINMDLADIPVTPHNKESLQDAKRTLRNMTNLLTSARRQLNPYGSRKNIPVLPAIQHSIHNTILSLRYTRTPIVFTSCKSIDSKTSITGVPLAFTNAVSILIRNAVEACLESDTPQVRIHSTCDGKVVRISVSDSGSGVAPDIQKRLFSPVQSSKPKGLGFGLYVAQNLAKTLFNGNLSLAPKEECSQEWHLNGATFLLEIPLNQKSQLRRRSRIDPVVAEQAALRTAL